MSFNAALSGLEAANQDLNVTANNLANAQTVGFKNSRTEFADLYASTQQSVALTQAGGGVKVSEVAQQFGQGDVNTTGNNLDLAITGNGFFTVRQPGGGLLYTRDGEFQQDSSGNVVDASGNHLQVYPALANGGFNTGGLQDLVLDTSESAPAATTTASLTANLPAGATPPADATFSPSDPNSYTNTTSLTVYDSLGAAHTATVYFANTGSGSWNTYLYMDGNAVNPDANGVATPQTLSYNSGGQLTSAASALDFGSYTPSTGAGAMDISFNMQNTTQYGSSFDVSAVSQNGYTTGMLTGLSIDASGVVSAQYTNGKTTALGQVALANFANTQGLQQMGDSNWSQTYASGEPVMGTAGNSSFGTIESGALEQSNVDTTTQLVNMITAQRTYQSNAQMIQTSDQMTQTIIQAVQNG